MTNNPLSPFTWELLSEPENVQLCLLPFQTSCNANETSVFNKRVVEFKISIVIIVPLGLRFIVALIFS